MVREPGHRPRLRLTRLEEPEPPAAFLEGSLDLELESAIPRLLLLRFERLRGEQVGEG